LLEQAAKNWMDYQHQLAANFNRCSISRFGQQPKEKTFGFSF